VAQPVTAPTTLRIFPGADGQFTLYDDDGQSLDYCDGPDTKTVWIRFRWHEAARQLVIEPDERMKRWPGGTRTYEIEIVGGGAKSGRIEFSGVPVTVDL
jgi:hypothetical protein